ncbi:alpha/beta fold hydrolase [Corynebacterium sp. TAE3-ERU12]|uniref:esterase/lipase family protein n=1 Tax=Corynebacterium sp. TAE3-ERU12 TaxID=2849491 RepID=UPI001C4908A4|nr:alpha/beta fold hydrolase [Corynebacterium sp. TAE3-ERU12]MBV7294379.1 alpha/beta fold hydrolase [Corynebacterium sp. TAE3-ERU12]
MTNTTASHTAANAPAATGPRTNFFPVAFYRQLRSPGLMPAGLADDVSDAAGSENVPVVLIHGTWMSAYSTFAMLAPELKKAGFNCYSFDYGADPDCFVGKNKGVAGTADLTASTAEVERRINEVLERTGADRVDLVCHSQGSIHGRAYAKKYGADKVRTIVSLGGNHHGVTLGGVATVGTALEKIGIPAFAMATKALGPAGLQQVPGAEVFDGLNGASEVVEGVRYVNLATKFDWIATPWRGAFLDYRRDAPQATSRQVTNIHVPDLAPGEWPDHLSMLYSPVVAQQIIASLKGTQPQLPERSTVLPSIGAVPRWVRNAVVGVAGFVVVDTIAATVVGTVKRLRGER